MLEAHKHIHTSKKVKKKKKRKKYIKTQKVNTMGCYQGLNRRDSLGSVLPTSDLRSPTSDVEIPHI